MVSTAPAILGLTLDVLPAAKPSFPITWSLGKVRNAAHTLTTLKPTLHYVSHPQQQAAEGYTGRTGQVSAIHGSAYLAAYEAYEPAWRTGQLPAHPQALYKPMYHQSRDDGPYVNDVELAYRQNPHAAASPYSHNAPTPARQHSTMQPSQSAYGPNTTQEITRAYSREPAVSRQQTSAAAQAVASGPLAQWPLSPLQSQNPARQMNPYAPTRGFAQSSRQHVPADPVAGPSRITPLTVQDYSYWDEQEKTEVLADPDAELDN